MKRILASTFAIAISIITQAQTAFDVFSYKEPTGYQKEIKTNVISYSKSSTKENSYCIIGLYAASAAAATAQQTFAKEWKELVEIPWGATNPKIENSDDVNGWKTILGTSTFEFNGGKCAVMQFCFVNNTQTASIVVLTNSKSYEQDILALLESLHLSKTRTTDNGKPSLVNNLSNTKPQSTSNKKTNQETNTVNSNSTKANMQTDKLTGVWVAYYLSYANKEMTFDQKVFLPNGQFLNDMPIGGVDNFDVTVNPIYTYKLSGNNGTYIDAGKKYPGTFTIKAANKIELESRTYSKSADINGKLFNASYTSWSNEDSPEFKEQPIGNRPVIHFYADGKFYNEGIFKHLHDVEPNSRQGKGTYFIKNYSLYLRYDDGRPVQKYSIATWGESIKFEETKILMLSGGALFKMKKP